MEKKHKLNNAEFYTKETTQDNDTKTDKALNSEDKQIKRI
jgi:hypothetical protein